MTSRLERAKAEWHQAAEREQRARWELDEAQREADRPDPHADLKKSVFTASASAAAGAVAGALAYWKESVQ